MTRWYVDEQDLRGHDPELGWVHAVAHGADFFGACGAAGSGIRPPCSMPSPANGRAHRFVWRDQEEDRVAHALALVLARPDVDEPTAVGWLDHVRTMFASGSPGPVPAEASNTMRTLRSLHVALGEQPLRRGEPVTVQHGELVREQIAALLHEVTPWSWRPRQHPREEHATRRRRAQPGRDGPSARANRRRRTAYAHVAVPRSGRDALAARVLGAATTRAAERLEKPEPGMRTGPAPPKQNGPYR